MIDNKSAGLWRLPAKAIPARARPVIESSTMQRNIVIALTGSALALASYTYAQRSSEVPSWAPKPTTPTKYVPPHKPHTKLADVRAQHTGHKDWRQLVVD